MADTNDPLVPEQNKASRAAIRVEVAKSLKQKRESRKLRIEDICQVIKIRTPILKSLESGNWDDVPGGVYLRAFLSEYAKYLDVKIDKSLEAYFADVPPSTPEDDDVETTDQIDSRARTVWIAIGVAALVLVGLIKVVTVESDRTPEPSASETNILAIEAAPAPEAPAPPAPAEAHELTVFSPYPLWMRVEADNQSFEGFIPQSSTWTWEGEGRFAVRLGHTREVDMRFDGERVQLSENRRRLNLPNGP